MLSRESYDIYRKSNEFTPGVATTGVMDFVGYGFTNNSINQCADPTNAGIKRQGKNRFEGTADQVSSALGLAPFTPVGSQLAFDFDNGNSANDAFGAPALGLTDPNGLGASVERAYGQGDSGGPNILNGKIAGVTSTGIVGVGTDLCGGVILSAPGQFYVSTRVSYHQKWIDSFFPPRVMGVTVGTSLNSQADYEIRSGYSASGPPDCSTSVCDIKALQLQTVPVARPNEILVKFSKSVQASLTVSSLQVTSEKYLGTSYSPTGLTYDSATDTAKWSFTTPIGPSNNGDQVALRLTSVSDASGSLLDGEWTNPVTADASNGSEFPTGNWRESGTNTFVFYLTFAPADFNRDNVVDGADFNIWNANKFTVVTNGFGLGDANGVPNGLGQDVVDGSDWNIWNAMKFTSWRSWPGSQQGAGAPSGGVNSPSATWLAAYDQLVTRHRLYVNGQLNRALTQSDWARFADELTLLLARIY